jgi:uncharacterized integral membrane protein (TIGR00698 family)
MALSRIGLTHPATWARAPIAGVALALSLAAAAKLGAAEISGLGQGTGIPVSATVLAVLLGIAWRNTFGLSSRFEPGVRLVAQRVLRIGIALVGLRLTLAGMAAVGPVAITVAVGCLITALLTATLVGRLLGLPRAFTQLLALGTAVCGCTAVAAAAPVLRARAADTGVALTCVVLLGSTGMLLYPWLADAFFRGNAPAAGMFLGTAIHDTSQVIGAAMIYAQQFAAPDTVAVAGFTKLLRNLSMLVLIPLAAISMRDSTDGATGAAARMPLRQAFPGFLIAFVLLAMVRTAGDAAFAGTGAAQAWSGMITAGLAASDLLLVCGMTAIGLGVSLREVRSLGWRAFLAAAVVALAVCSVSVLAVSWLCRPADLIGADRRQTDLTAAISAATAFCPSPYSIRVLSR